jgi:hypothetical protein
MHACQELCLQEDLAKNNPGHNVLVAPPMTEIVGHVNDLVHEAFGECHELSNSPDA